MGATDVPKQIGPYEILGPLGKGGMGAVYKAMQPSLNRIVAIKVLPPDFAKDPDAVTRFHREAQTVAMLSHPNIVQIIDKGEDQGLLYFAMEYVEGTSLDVVLRQRRLSLQEVVQVIKQIGRGLGAAHRAGVVHRDLNPRNILVSPTLSVVKLADFGISRVESVARSLGTLTTREMTLGSLHYLAPEQAVDASAVDHRADIYSLGVVFYEALTGRIPLGKFSLPSELNRELPPEIDPVVLKCLATEPGDRYATVGQLLDDIDKLENLLRFQLLDELKGLKRGTTMLFKKGSTSFQRNRWILVLFGLLALALVGVGGWMLLHPVEESPTKSAAPAAAEAPAAPDTVAESAPAPADSAAAPESTPPESATPTTETAAPAVPADQAAGKTTQPTAAPQKKGTAAAPVAPEATPPAEAKPKPSKPAVDPAIADLEVAQGKFDAKLFAQALADAKTVVETYPASPVAIDGYFLIAKSLINLQREREALGAYVEIQTRFKSDPRAAEAAFLQAKLVRSADTKKTTEEARKLYADCAAGYPTSPWAARALAEKADIEREQRGSVRDAALAATVPAALPTYRELTERFPADAVAEKAWWELGQMYEDLKRWDLAAKAYEELELHFPKTRFDAWYQAGEIYDRRLKDPAKAKNAFAMVPATSPHYREAQKKAGN
jgi:tRNA A-37 threonylcarbamoyl transferase component Bud32/TolA-binding protein